jgi:hypothetical protein
MHGDGQYKKNNREINKIKDRYTTAQQRLSVIGVLQ